MVTQDNFCGLAVGGLFQAGITISCYASLSYGLFGEKEGYKNYNKFQETKYYFLKSINFGDSVKDDDF